MIYRLTSFCSSGNTSLAGYTWASMAAFLPRGMGFTAYAEFTAALAFTTSPASRGLNYFHTACRSHIPFPPGTAPAGSHFWIYYIYLGNDSINTGFAT